MKAPRTESISANNRVQGTRHKVSGPLTRDVRIEKSAAKFDNHNGCDMVAA